MRVLLDECVPRPLKRDLTGHSVNTVPEMQWQGIENGELLRRMREAGFEAFVTVEERDRGENRVDQNQVGHDLRSQAHPADSRLSSPEDASHGLPVPETGSGGFFHCFFPSNIVFWSQTMFEPKKHCSSIPIQCFFPSNIEKTEKTMFEAKKQCLRRISGQNGASSGEDRGRTSRIGGRAQPARAPALRRRG